MPVTQTNAIKLPRPFWVIWGVEFWERFGYYGMQSLLALYFVHYLGYSQKESIYIFGAFTAFVYGFVWIGGFIGDKYLGAKRTIVIGAAILMISYFALALSNMHTVFYALAGIIVGNTLFKANPSSLISKLYEKGDSALDSAMTMYYMAINIGSFVSMAITPILAKAIGWEYAFAFCGFGLFCALLNYFIFYHILEDVATEAGKEVLEPRKIFYIILVSIAAVFVVGKLLHYYQICYAIVFVVVTAGFAYFLKIAFGLEAKERTRMLVAFVLILEAVIFFVLYNQMPTTLTFFAVHNINNHVLGFVIPAAEYQALNPITIIIMSPILAWLYQRVRGTHATKFCIGISLCALAFMVLWIPQFTATAGSASSLWLVLTYFLQSTGELLVSGLGLAMVAELCPRNMSGFVMGIWFLTTMLAGPLGAIVGALTAPPTGVHYTALESIHIYGHVFMEMGAFTAIVAIIMWITRPWLNKVISGEKEDKLSSEVVA